MSSRGDFQAVVEYFKLWNKLISVVIMNNCIYHCLAQCNPIPVAMRDSFFVCYFVCSLILNIQPIKNLLACFDERTVTVFIAVYQFYSIQTGIFSNLNRISIPVCKKVCCIIINAVFGEQFKIVCKLVIDFETIFVVIDFQLFESQILPWCSNATD